MFNPALVRDIRRYRDMTLQQLAGHLAVTRQTLSRREQGRSPWTLDQLEQAAGVLNVSLGQILGLCPFEVNSEEDNRYGT